MYKGTELPSNYNDLTIQQKEALWLGTLLVYEHPKNFDSDYWHNKIVTYSETILFEDENIILYKCYTSEYLIRFKNGQSGFSSGFPLFFTDEYLYTDEFKNCPCNNIGKYIHIEEYNNSTLVDYLRSKGFPITAEFWNEWDS